MGAGRVAGTEEHSGAVLGMEGAAFQFLQTDASVLEMCIKCMYMYMYM